MINFENVIGKIIWMISDLSIVIIDDFGFLIVVFNGMVIIIVIIMNVDGISYLFLKIIIIGSGFEDMSVDVGSDLMWVLDGLIMGIGIDIIY